MAAFVPIIMVLGRIAVKVGSETVKKYLKKNGFRIAKDYKKYAETVTQKDLPALLKKVKDASGVKPRNVRGSGGSTMTIAGGRGQSALGRRIALSKMKNYVKVGPKSPSIPKKPPKNPPKNPIETPVKPPVAKRIAQIANIGAGVAIAKVAYDAYKEDEVSKNDLEVLTRPTSGLSKEAQAAIRKLKGEIKKPIESSAQRGTKGFATRKPTPRQSAKFADTPARKAAIMRALKEAIAFGKDKMDERDI